MTSVKTCRSCVNCVTEGASRDDMKCRLSGQACRIERQFGTCGPDGKRWEAAR